MFLFCLFFHANHTAVQQKAAQTSTPLKPSQKTILKPKDELSRDSTQSVPKPQHFKIDADCTARTSLAPRASVCDFRDAERSVLFLCDVIRGEGLYSRHMLRPLPSCQWLWPQQMTTDGHEGRWGSAVHVSSLLAQRAEDQLHTCPEIELFISARRSEHEIVLPGL